MNSKKNVRSFNNNTNKLSDKHTKQLNIRKKALPTKESAKKVIEKLGKTQNLNQGGDLLDMDSSLGDYAYKTNDDLLKETSGLKISSDGTFQSAVSSKDDVTDKKEGKISSETQPELNSTADSGKNPALSDSKSEKQAKVSDEYDSKLKNLNVKKNVSLGAALGLAAGCFVLLWFAYLFPVVAIPAIIIGVGASVSLFKNVREYRRDLNSLKYEHAKEVEQQLCQEESAENQAKLAKDLESATEQADELKNKGLENDSQKQASETKSKESQNEMEPKL